MTCKSPAWPAFCMFREASFSSIRPPAPLPSTPEAAAEPVDVFPAGLDRHGGGFVALPADGAVAIQQKGHSCPSAAFQCELVVCRVETDFLGAAFIVRNGNGAGDMGGFVFFFHPHVVNRRSFGNQRLGLGSADDLGAGQAGGRGIQHRGDAFEIGPGGGGEREIEAVAFLQGGGQLLLGACRYGFRLYGQRAQAAPMCR